MTSAPRKPAAPIATEQPRLRSGLPSTTRTPGWAMAQAGRAVAEAEAKAAGVPFKDDSVEIPEWLRPEMEG
jgi:hypothetical protein